MTPVVRAAGLVKRFGGVTAVDGVSFDIAPASCVGVLGPNGAGKTTTLRMILGMTPLSAGSPEVFNAGVSG